MADVLCQGSRQNIKNSSRAVTLRLLLVVIVLVRLYGVPGTLGKLSGQVFVDFYTALTYLLMASYVVWHFLIKGELLKTRITVPFMVICIFFIALGVATCVSDYVPISSLMNVIRLILLASFAFAVVESIRLADLFKCLFASLTVVVLLCLLALALPGYGFVDYESGPVFTGIWSTKNVCAGALAFFSLSLYGMLTFLQSEDKRPFPVPRVLLIFMFCVCLGLLLMTDALGALICAVVPAVLVYAEDKGAPFPSRKGLFWVVISVSFLLLATVVMPYFSEVLAFFGKSANLTGRTDIWASITQLVAERSPIFGFGYGDFWLDGSPVYYLIKFVYASNGMLTVHVGSHNAIIEMLLMFGFVGVVSYLFMLVIVFDKMRCIENKIVFNLVNLYFIYFMLYCLTERSLSNIGFQTFFLFSCIAIVLISYNEAMAKTEP